MITADSNKKFVLCIRVHADLFGPMITADSNRKFVLCITDAFTKYAVVMAIAN